MENNEFKFIAQNPFLQIMRTGDNARVTFDIGLDQYTNVIPVPMLRKDHNYEITVKDLGANTN